jgi:hypothetical protein
MAKERSGGWIQRVAAATALLAIVAVLGSIIGISSVVTSDSPLPPEKQAIVDQQAAFRSQGATLPTAVVRGPPPAGSLGGEPIQGTAAGAGTIYEDGPPPFPSAAYSLQNHWRAMIGSQTLVVWAGANGQDPEQGVILVMIEKEDGAYSEASRYETPLRLGSVRIVDAHGMVVRVRAADGTAFEFDTSSRSFADAQSQ